ncbi:MAG: hypothetical protein IJM37_03510 [Lachnospiraceae bacterium]|nr:hypothetical protein [Lachnospiraceae bacterium]
MANKENSVSKEMLLEMLEVEADKSETEIDVERINKITQLLDTYGGIGNSSNDYEEFLRRFNERNGTHLKNCLKTQKLSIFKLYTINHVENIRVSASVAVAMLLIMLNVALGIAGINPAYSIGVKAYNNMLGIVNEYVELDKLQYTAVHADEEEFDILDSYYVTYDEDSLKDLDIMKPTYNLIDYKFESAMVLFDNNKLSNIELIYNSEETDHSFSCNIQLITNDDYDFYISNRTDFTYENTIEVNGVSVYIYTGSDNKAMFFSDNKLYTVISDVNMNAFYEIIKSFSF